MAKKLITMNSNNGNCQSSATTCVLCWFTMRKLHGSENLVNHRRATSQWVPTLLFCITSWKFEINTFKITATFPRGQWVNSLAPEIFEWNLKQVIFKLISGKDGWGIFCEIGKTPVRIILWCPTTKMLIKECFLIQPLEQEGGCQKCCISLCSKVFINHFYQMRASTECLNILIYWSKYWVDRLRRTLRRKVLTGIFYQQLYRLCHYISHQVAHIDYSAPSGKQHEPLTAGSGELPSDEYHWTLLIIS